MELVYTGYQYRLRAGAPMPTKNSGVFVLHTFMAEKSQIDFVSCTDALPESKDFRGQGGELVSASFSQLAVAGGGIFSGKKTYSPEFIEEDDLNG